MRVLWSTIYTSRFLWLATKVSFNMVPLYLLQGGVAVRVCWGRPVGTNLVLVRRVMAKNLLSMKAERAERVTAWGPGARSRAPGGVQGQSPGGGPGGSAPGSSWVLASVKCPERLSWKYFFFNQPTSAWYRNVSIKWHSSLCRVNFRPSCT